MRREEKEAIIDNLAQRLDETKHFYLTDISSLNAEQTSDLRRKCFEKEISLLVVKNGYLVAEDYFEGGAIDQNRTTLTLTKWPRSPA